MDAISSAWHKGHTLGFEGEADGRSAQWRRALADAPKAFAEQIQAAKARMAGHDPLDMITACMIINSFSDPNTYRETADSRMVVTSELAQLLLAAGGPAPRPRDSPDPDLWPDAHAALEHLKAALFRGALRDFTDGDASESFALIRRRFVTQSQLIRTMSFVHQDRDIVAKLFQDPGAAADLAAAAGFTGAQAIASTTAIFDQIADVVAQSREAAAIARGPRSRWPTSADLTGLGARIALDPGALAARSGVPVDAAQAFLERFSVPIGDAALPRVTDTTHRARLRPLLSDGARAVPSLPNNLWPALRVGCEQALKDADDPGLWERYSHRRGALIEDEVLAELSRFLSPDVAVGGVPLKRRKQDLGEIDGLVVLETIGLTVEAKSGGLWALSNTDDPQALRRNIKDLVVKAAAQTHRGAAAMSGQQQLTGADGRPFTVPPLTDLFGIAVTLEDTSFVGPVIWHLREDGQLPAGLTPPWVVSLSQLQTICLILEFPAQLVDFLRRRRLMIDRQAFRATDELDLFGEYLQHGLAYDNYPTTIGNALLPSHTDDIAAYVNFKLGVRTVVTPRPRQQFVGRTGMHVRKELRRLNTDRPAHWLQESLALIDAHRVPPPTPTLSELVPGSR